MADDDADDEWRFSIDDVGPDEEENDEAASDDAADDGYFVQTVGEDDDGPTVGVATSGGDAGEDDGGGNVAGSIAPDMSVEPGTPDLEGAVFATAGAILTALVFAGIVTQLDPRTVAGITGGIVGAAGLLYLLFRRF